MFYPLQIPNILDPKFKESLDYQEFIPKQLEEYIMCIWSMKSNKKIEEPITNVILPDGCIDIVINFKTGEIVFSAMSKDTKFMTIQDDIDFMGIRFRPGVFHLLYEVDSFEVMDRKTRYQRLETFPLHRILELKTYSERIHFLEIFLNCIVEDKKIDPFISFINQTKNMTDVKYVSELSKKLGYSEKQANRIFIKRCGYSLKTYLNIIRLHNSLHALIYQDNDLTSIAIESGYYDQSHFIKDLEKYCGVSPTELIESYKK